MLLKTTSHLNKRTVGKFYDDDVVVVAAAAAAVVDDDHDSLMTIMRPTMMWTKRLSSNLALKYWPNPIESK